MDIVGSSFNCFIQYFLWKWWTVDGLVGAATELGSELAASGWGSVPQETHSASQIDSTK